MPEWRDIPGWEGLYQVSTDGQVKSLPRKRRRSELIVSQQRHPESGKWSVMLWNGKQVTNMRVHNLVLMAFIGPRPPGMFGLHRDDNPDNNQLLNLRWGTRSENSYDMIANGNHNHARKTHCKWGHPLKGDNLILNKRQRLCKACKRRRQSAYYAKQERLPKPKKRCPDPCGASHARRSKYCSETCAARARYRKRVGVSIEAPRYASLRKVGV